jgi:ankyrin repeat protein
MSNLDLIVAVRSEDLQAVGELLRSSADVNQEDEQGWTALSYAAGRGDLDMVKMLVEHGANVFKVDNSQRTPYAIALAAGRADVAAYLREVEDAITGEKSPRRPRAYCKAYYLGDLRKYPGWFESRINWKANADGDLDGNDLSDDSIVFIHQDHTVTMSMWHNEDVIFNMTTPEWADFCARELGFSVPDDLELIASKSAA